jgi:hypothetical protein
MPVFGFAFRRAIGALGTVVAAASLAACSGAAGPPNARPWDPSLLASGHRDVQCRQIAACAKPPRQILVSNIISSGSGFASQIDIYPVGSNGDVAPTTIIAGSQTLLGNVNGVVVDSSGEIFVVNTDTNSILGFLPGSSGNVGPNVVISGSNTQMATPIGLALDEAGNLYVDNWGPPGSVEEFAAGSNGNVAPMRRISGSRTQLTQHLNGIAVDGQGVIYVACAGPNSINIFAPSANGNVAPHRLILGSNTGISGPDGIAVDANGIYVAETGGPYIVSVCRRPS